MIQPTGPAPAADARADGQASGAPAGQGAEVLVVSGMSGAGRSTVGNVLEDHGWYVIDNLPIALLDSLLDLSEGMTAAPGTAQPYRGPRRVGVIVDVRAQGFATLADALARTRAQGWRTSLLFLDATDEALVRRFESVRRPHPLQRGGRLLDAIQTERAALADLRTVADVVVDTSGLNVHQLARKVAPLVADPAGHQVRVAVLSFGFKYGIPLDADFVLDLRFLPNPHWVPQLRARTGTESVVADYVLGQPGAPEFLAAADAMLAPVLAGYVRENRRYATVAVGCTGGKHRSVAVAEALAARLAGSEVATFVAHRDLGQE